MNTTADVVVVNKNGVAAYQFDTSLGGTCFGDQPKTGFDNNALVISTDEYCGANETEIGAIAVVISKPQLVARGRDGQRRGKPGPFPWPATQSSGWTPPSAPAPARRTS